MTYPFVSRQRKIALLLRWGSSVFRGAADKREHVAW